MQITVECPVYDSFRVQQVAGMFDVPLAEKLTQRFEIDLPPSEILNLKSETSDWQIGLIVGPSGSGKTTLARQLFSAKLYDQPPWPKNRAVIDCFGDLSIHQITGLLTAVGFSSPPSWVKPYRVLSGGERFRCDLAQALAGGSLHKAADGIGGSAPLNVNPPNSVQRRTAADAIRGFMEAPLVVFDEFTSVVDRTVAKIGSAAVAKAIRGGQIGCRFIAVTCHYDVTEWLAPDWVIDMATCSFSRRRLRRPAIELELFRCGRQAWKLFARHHYLSGGLSPAAQCYLATWHDEPVTFVATLPLQGYVGRRRISRIVTLPDYQGIGIGMKVTAAVADVERQQGHRVSVTASHPAVIAHCRRSPLWRTSNVIKTNAQRRAVVSFEYLHKAADGIRGDAPLDAHSQTTSNGASPPMPSAAL